MKKWLLPFSYLFCWLVYAVGVETFELYHGCQMVGGLKNTLFFAGVMPMSLLMDFWLKKYLVRWGVVLD